MSDTPIDTSRTVEIAASPAKQVLGMLGALAFVVLGYFMSQATDDTSRHAASTIQFWGWLSMAVFGLFGLLGLWRLLTQRGAVITLSPQGIHDVRVTHEVVPWPAVDNISEWSLSGQKIMVLGLKPGEEEKLRLTTIARMSRGANARLGADGLSVTAQGSKVSHATLMQTAIAYARAHGGA